MLGHTSVTVQIHLFYISSAPRSISKSALSCKLHPLFVFVVAWKNVTLLATYLFFFIHNRKASATMLQAASELQFRPNKATLLFCLHVHCLALIKFTWCL